MAAIDTKVRVLTATASISDSEVDMTSSGAGTAVWYMLFITGDYTDGGTDTGAAKMSMGFGWITGTTTAEDIAYGSTVQTSQDPQVSACRGASAKSAMIMSDDGTFLSDYIDFKTRITDGITFEFNGGSNAGTTYRLCAIVGFGDWQVDVGEFTALGVADAETTITLDTTFTDVPEAFFVGCFERDFDNTIYPDFRATLGFTSFTQESGTDDFEQFCSAFSLPDGATAPDGQARLISAADSSGGSGWLGDRIYARAAGFGDTPGGTTLEVTGRAAGEVTVTKRVAAANKTCMYMALSSSGVVDMDCTLWDMPSGTGDVSYSGAAFEGVTQAFLGIFGLIDYDDIDGFDDLTNAGRVQAFSGADTNGDEFTCGWRIRNNATNLNQSWGHSAKCVNTRTQNGTPTHEGTLKSMDAGGFTLDITNGLVDNPGIPIFLWSEPKVTITPTGLDAGLAFGAPRPGLRLSPDGLDAGVALGNVDPSLRLEPAGLDPGTAFGSIAPSLRVSPDGLDAGLALGAPSLALRLAPAGLDAAAGFGAPALSLRVSPAGLAAPLAFGGPSLALRLALTGLGVDFGLGEPSLLLTQQIAPGGLGIPVTLGGPTLSLKLEPDGLAVAGAFGNPSLALAIGPTGLAVQVVFGIAAVQGPQVVLAPSPGLCVVQSGLVAGIVSQSGMVQANAVQSGRVAGMVSQSGMVAAQSSQSGMVAGGVA